MDKDLLHVKVIREVLSRISAGIYPHGQRLPAERELCRQFNISRGTLRRALADLEKMGAVQIRPQSGAYVQRLPKSSSLGLLPLKPAAKATLREIVFARKAIELAAIELASQRISESDIRNLETCIQGMERNLDNLPEYLHFDIAFHEQIIQSSQNPALIAAFEAIAEYHRYSQVFSSSSDTCEADAIRHHRRILAAMMKKDVSQSISALRRHFDAMLK